MIYTLDYLRSDDIKLNAACIDDKWVPARPITGTFRWEKLRAAWEVLRGRADAFTWPGGQ
jgi:hypothetical protein